MLKALTNDQSLILGITAENVKRLAAGDPISFCMSDLSLPIKPFLICHGTPELLEQLELPAGHEIPFTVELGNGAFLFVLTDATIKELLDGEIIDLNISESGLPLEKMTIYYGINEEAVANCLDAIVESIDLP